jgi:transposase-like protein
MDQDGTRPKKQRSKPYDADFKRSVVEHWVSSRQTAAQVARDFGVNIWNLRDWKRQYGPAPKGVDEPVPESPQEMRREIQQLRKALAETIHQREILKKTLGIISET